MASLTPDLTPKLLPSLNVREQLNDELRTIKRSDGDPALQQSRRVGAILSSPRLYAFRRPWPPPGEADSYRLPSNGGGGHLHLTDAVESWLVPGQNPFGLYLHIEEVDALAAKFRDEIIGKNAPEDKPWGMYEFAVSDPDQTLVRVGWPTRLRSSK